MKKIYLLLGILFIWSAVLQAQYPTNRTPKTIVADVLAQMPAQYPDQYNTQIKDLASAGEEGVLQLVKMMSPLGKGSNAQVEYALSGLSHYVSAEGQEASRLVVSNAYIKALDMVTDREIKAFIIRQLEVSGKDEAINKLSSYLNDEKLSGPAARALSAIGKRSANVGTTLLNSLGTVTNDKSKKDIINALAELKLPAAEVPLKNILANASDPNLRSVTLYALSQCGSSASLKELTSAAQEVNFDSEPTGATEAYIALIKRVLSQGDTKSVESAASGLMKNAEKSGKIQMRESALQILMMAKVSDVLKLTQKALKDSNRDYRYAALNFASPYADKSFYTELVKVYKKGSQDVKIDILNWLCQESDDVTKQSLVKGLESRLFIPELSSNNFELKSSAAHLLACIGGEQAVSALADLLNNQDKQTITLAENLLNTVDDNISPSVAAIIPSAPEEGKIAGLRLLSNRKSDTYVETVIEQINNASSANVKNAAYAVLKHVVSSKDLPVLYTLLESAQPDATASVQQAITAALKDADKDTQLKTITGQIEKAPANKKYLYYPILATTKHPEALEIISSMFGKGTGSAKDAAFQALLDWGGQEVADQLLAVCKDPSASGYFDRAFNKYIQLASSSELTGENRRLFLTNALEIAKTDEQKNEILKNMGQTNSFLGLLLAGKYLDQPAVQQSAAQAVMNIALSNKSITGKNVKALLNKVIEVLDNPDAGYQKEAIRKHLGEMSDEEGFVCIFNGKDLTGWKGLVENPVSRSKMKSAELAKKQIAADEIAKKHWFAKDGVLFFDGTGGDNLCSDKQYGDFEMWVDWNLDPAGPEADAGIYLRGTPQVQIWDIARVNVGAQVGSGGLYNNQSNPSQPLKLADNKLGEWNTFYIKMVGDRVTVKLNDVLVVDNVILENFWDRSQPIFSKEQIELQAHGSKVYYRNIYVKELQSPKPFELSAQEKKDGFRILFDGTNMHNWTGNTIDYAIQDGCISLDPKGGHGGNLYTKEEFSDFIYRFEFQLTAAANNGVGIRTPMDVDAAYHGMEIQILDHDNPVYKDITPLQVHGSVYGIIGAKRGYLKPVGEWNQEEIIANGDHIKVTLNGTVILDGNIREATKNGTADGQQHPGLFNKKGYIGFLGHGSPVKFKNIRIKELNNRK
ncbi:MAG: family 16 glycoside hydrolase [Dysgonomonas sp.]|nr:family 16 glycoside hydrolase [Dysgonomonas sp.]